MSRIRSLKPAWLDDEKLASTDDATRVLSVALILLADDYGNGRASPVWLAARVWPYLASKEGLARVTGAMSSLARVGFVTLYEVRGERYYALTNWSKHQRIDNAGRPAVPTPDEADPSHSAKFRESPRNSAKLRESRRFAALARS